MTSQPDERQPNEREPAEAAARAWMRALGLDPDEPRLADTARRMVEAGAELFGGIGVDAGAVLHPAAPELPATGPVAVRGIPFTSMCEHHLLPFRGRADVVYLPGDTVVGLGEIDRMIRVLAARPQLQERLGDEIAATLDAAIAPRAVLVRLRADHACMWARGPRTVDAEAVTLASRGDYDEPGPAAIALALLTD